MVNATEIFVNDTVKWTITVVNNGPSAAKDVVVNDTIPSGLEFVVPENCTFDGKYLIWNCYIGSECTCDFRINN